MKVTKLYAAIIIFTICLPGMANAALTYNANGDCLYSITCTDLSGELIVSELVFNESGTFIGNISMTGFNNDIFYDFEYGLASRSAIFNNDRTEIIGLTWYDNIPGLDATLILDNGQIRYDTGDLLFDNVVVVQAVPLPAAVWLFGSGLLGLFVVAKRKT